MRSKNLLVLGFGVLASVALASSASADPLDSWQSGSLGDVHSIGTAPVANVTPLLYANGVFYSTSARTPYFEKIVKSTDGVNWTPISNLPTQTNISVLSYANGQFLVGEASGNIATSADGVTWAAARVQTSYPDGPTCLAYGNGTYVFTGGTAWNGGSDIGHTSRVLPAVGAAPTCIAFGKGLFVSSTTANISTSPNGATWTTRSSTAGFTRIAAGTNGFMAVGARGTIASSPDGIAWTARSLPASSGSPTLTGVAYGKGGWVIVGNAGTTPVIYSSPDGYTWTPHTFSAPNVQLNDVVAGDTFYVVSGISGVNGVTYASGVFTSVSLTGGNVPVQTNPKPINLPSAPTAPVVHVP